MKSIVRVPHTILSTPAKPIEKFDAKLIRLIEQMKKSLIATKNPKGVGLAAPQIGEPYQVFITKPTDESDIRTFINPTILTTSEDKTSGVPEKSNKLEGCLSIPNVWGKVKRAKSVTLSYQDEKGIHHEEVFTGFPATIAQHETDHLNGILFTQRVLEQHGAFFQSTIDTHGKEVLEEMNI